MILFTAALVIVPLATGVGLHRWASRRWRANEPLVIAGTGAATAFVMVLVVGFSIQTAALRAELRAQEEEIRAAAFVRDSLEAVADTFRVHVLAHDSARTVSERRALQAEIAHDSVDRLLRTDTRSRTRVVADVERLDTTATAAVSDTAGIRFARWDGIRRAPYTVDIAISMPPPPDSARFRLGIQLDPVDLTVRLGCEDMGRPVHAARVSVEGPEWLRVGSLDGISDPDVCNPILTLPDPPSRWPTIALVTGSAIIGGLVDDNPLRGAAVGAPLGLSLDLIRRGVGSLQDSFRR